MDMFNILQGVLSTAIDWSMLESQYLEDQQYRQDIRKMLCMDDDHVSDTTEHNGEFKAYL
jgi:hypothetical protein